MARKIDYDRGVVIKTINTLGMDVFMYRGEPGVYYAATGALVPAALAAQAGYDTEELEKVRLRNERIATATDAVNKEMDLVETVSTSRVVASYGDFSVVAFGKTGRHTVEDQDGTSLTPGTFLSLEMATSVAQSMAGVTKANPPKAKVEATTSTPQPTSNLVRK